MTIEVRDIDSLANEFKTWTSTLKNILREFKPWINDKELKLSKHASKVMQSKIIQNYVHEYVENNTDPFWVDDLAKYIWQKWGVKVQKHQLRSFIKKQMNLTYKKGWSRPSYFNLDLQKYFKWLFWIKLVHKLKKGLVIVNIDESILNRNTRIHYSWLQKGENWPVTNTKFNNSISLISVICTNGLSVSGLITGIINGSNFIEFLQRLKLELKRKCNVRLDEWIIIMDNWSVHKSKLTKSYLSKWNAKVHYIVAYSPELAPI